MELLVIIGIGLAFVIAVLTASVLSEQHKLQGMSPEERKKYQSRMRNKQQTEKWGSTNTSMVCPHCQTQGAVKTKSVVRKKGISGGKATAAILTGGVSLIATGLSRNENMTQAHCDKCNNSWDF